MIRVILDAHISGPVVGENLERKGHDVFSVDQHPGLEGLPDQDLLSLAVEENRVLVTANVRHFLPLLTARNAAGESHAGCILILKSISNEDFGVLISGIEQVLEGTSQEGWVDLVRWVQRR